MKYTDFASYIRKRTRTDSTTFTDANILLSANAHKDIIADRIEQKNEGYFDMKMYRDLSANVRQYSLPENFLNRIRRVEVTLDGTNWYVANEVEFNQLTYPITETDIQNNNSDYAPRYFLQRKSMTLLTGSAISTVADGLRLYSKVYPADFTDLTSTDDMSEDPTTTTIGFPKQFHVLLADAVIIEYKNEQDRPIPLTESEAAWESRMQKALDSIAEQNIDNVLTVKFNPQYEGDYGYNY